MRTGIVWYLGERTTFKVEGAKIWYCRIRYMELIVEEVWERTSQELLRLLDVRIGKLFSKFVKIQIECEGIDVQKSGATLNPAALIFFSFSATSRLGLRHVDGEVSRSHTITHTHTEWKVGLLCTSDQLIARLTAYTTHTNTRNTYTRSGIRTRYPLNQVTSDLRQLNCLRSLFQSLVACAINMRILILVFFHLKVA
jgi:hypothetical protein